VKVHLLALLFVGMMVLGQVLFRAAANSIDNAGTFFAAKPLAVIAGAFAVYGVASIMWIAMLRVWPLGQIYPYVGLSFVFVPLAAWLIYGDAISARQMLGSLVIAAGVLIAATA